LRDDFSDDDENNNNNNNNNNDNDNDNDNNFFSCPSDRPLCFYKHTTVIGNIFFVFIVIARYG